MYTKSILYRGQNVRQSTKWPPSCFALLLGNGKKSELILSSEDY